MSGGSGRAPFSRWDTLRHTRRYRRPPNHTSLLVRAALRKSKETYRGNSRYGQPRCKVYAHIKTGITFHSFTTNMEFCVKATADCRIKNVVYLIEWAKCSIQYVGKTEKCSPILFNRAPVRYKPLKIGQTTRSTLKPTASLSERLYHYGNRKNVLRGC